MALDSARKSPEVIKLQGNPFNLKEALVYLNKKKYLYFLVIPCLFYFILFHYVPMYGVLIAFKKFSFAKGIMGSEWAGFENFKYMFELDDFYTVLY